VRYTEAPARRDELLRRLAAEGYVSSSRLAADLGVSEMTIRRDLRQLAADGHARRVPGGASLLGTANGAPFEVRDQVGGAEKRSIATACLALLTDAATVALDAGTTVAPLAQLVAAGTMVVTHSAPIISACIDRDDIELIAVGGEYQRQTRSFAGPVARHCLDTLSVDVAVLSATAVDASGILCANTVDAEMKQGMAAIARTRILLIDHSKFGARAPIRVGRLDLVDVIVTDNAVDRDAVARLVAAGVRVVIAPPDRAANVVEQNG
jgi:DeoR/GlpR family transcriptional regulator of sugar metabolism